SRVMKAAEVDMFDLISGGPRHPFNDRTAAPVIVSVVGHAVMITLVFILPLLYVTGTVPSVPTMMAFVAAAPAPPPSPPPPLLAKVGGMVILEAVVGIDGSVESVRVLRSVKFLDQAAVDAVKQWQYSPLMLNGVAAPFVLTVTLNFRTQDK